jgi:cytochrome c551/c552
MGKVPALSCFLLLFFTPVLPGQEKPSDGIDFFETKIRPVLAEHCFSCHGPKKHKAGLRLDSAAHFFKGSESGPIVVKGKAEKSLLIQAVRQKGDVKMPPNGKLSDRAIADLVAWINMGAPWPKGEKATISDEKWKTHWAFQPVQKPELPAMKD